ncbi:hypothetical protein QUF73_24890 [Cytobacillus sp. NJ13]|nr:hypothetical protein [Cytobacillus sp. NJ13]
MTRQELFEYLRSELGADVDGITVEEYALKIGYVWNEYSQRYEQVTEV